jgi:CHASE1-domain containing sensor protein
MNMAKTSLVRIVPAIGLVGLLVSILPMTNLAYQFQQTSQKPKTEQQIKP